MERLWFNPRQHVKASFSCMASLTSQSIPYPLQQNVPGSYHGVSVAARGYILSESDLTAQERRIIYFKRRSLRHPLEHCIDDVNLLHLLNVHARSLENNSELQSNVVNSLSVVDSFMSKNKAARKRNTDVVF